MYVLQTNRDQLLNKNNNEKCMSPINATVSGSIWQSKHNVGENGFLNSETSWS